MDNGRHVEEGLCDDSFTHCNFFFFFYFFYIYSKQVFLERWPRRSLEYTEVLSFVKVPATCGVRHCVTAGKGNTRRVLCHCGWDKEFTPRPGLAHPGEDTSLRAFLAHFSLFLHWKFSTSSFFPFAFPFPSSEILSTALPSILLPPFLKV